MKRKATLVTSFILIFILTFTGCSNKEEAPVTIEEEYIAVEIETASLRDLYVENILTAKTTADSEVFVIPKVSGKVKSVNFVSGDRVNKDDILFVMDEEDIRKQADQAHAAYETANASYNVTAEKIKNAKDTLSRIQQLYEEGAVSETEYEQSKIAASDENLKAAQKSVDQARVAYESALSVLDDTAVRAPISGVISALNIVEGDFVTPSQPPVTIVDSDKIKVKLEVPGNMVKKISTGDEVTVEIESADYKEQKNVSSISTSANPANNLYTVEILLENNGVIKPGMFARVYFNTDTIENVLSVQSEAVIEKGGKKYVFTTNSDLAEEKEIITGLATDSYIEIKEGLSPEDKVVIRGQDYLSNGSKIKVVRGE